MKIQAVIFDLGGTLLHYHDPQSDDPQRPFRRTTQQGLRALMTRLSENGFALPATDNLLATIDRHIGEAWRAGFQELRGGSIETPIRSALAECDIHLTDEQWSHLRPAFYAPIDETVTARLGAHDTLSALRSMGLQLALISNTFWAADLHDRHLAEHGLLEFLPLRIYSCDTEHIKPHPAVFKQTLAALNVAPEQAVYVGDRLDTDVAGAQNVGMRGVLIRSPYVLEEPGNILPDAIIDELPDLLTALEQLNAKSA